MKIVIDEFLRAGHFGAIMIGTAPGHVLSCLGEPEAVSTFMKPVTIWRYGNVQIHCTSSSVELIMIYFMATSLPLWKAIVFEGWTPEREMRSCQFEAHLDTVHIPWRIDPLLTSGNQKTLSVGTANTSVIFSSDALQKIGVAGPSYQRRESIPKRKRVGK